MDNQITFKNVIHCFGHIHEENEQKYWDGKRKVGE